MQPRYSGKVQDSLINRLERQEKQQAFHRERFLRFNQIEIHNKLYQKLLMEKIIETENSAAVSETLLTGLKKAMNSSEFDLNYFIAPIRTLVPRPNVHSLYITQYIMEIVIQDPHVIDIYGTDEEIYEVVDGVFRETLAKYERVEEEVQTQLSHNKSLIPGTSEYELELNRLMRKKMGDRD